MEDIDQEFRHIRIDDGPRLQPLRLNEMFLRANQWAEAHPSTTPSSSIINRPPSPPRRRVGPLPRPTSQEISPLSGLFDYPELTPLVLEHFEHPRELAVLARVCSSWCSIARKKLYNHVWVRPWEDGCQVKLRRLMDTLSRKEDLCRLVRRLDVRFFPVGAQGSERIDLDDQVRKALEQMHNLESLVWTRDRSLTPELVEVIADHPKLRSLEISGHSYRQFIPTSLGRSTSLEELRVMMPDTNLRDRLVGIIKDLSQREQGGLRSLGLICRSSPLIDDEVLKAAAPSLTNLRCLTLWGCTRVTNASVYRILEQAEDIQELSLDASPHSNLLDLSRAPNLSLLHTLSLSFPCPNKGPLNLADLPTLPPLPNLSSLHLTLSGSSRHLPSDYLFKLESEIASCSINRLSLLNLIISADQLSVILSSYPNLDELYISIDDPLTLRNCVELQGCGLEVFHVNAPNAGIGSDDLLEVAKGIKALDQVGTGNRVYEVFRTLDEEDETVIELGRWGRTYTPAYFQIWRG